MQEIMDRYKATFETYNKVALQYQDKFMDLDLYNDTYDKFCALLSKDNSKILEIGSGPGNITRYLLTKKPDLNIMGIDMAPMMIELARKNNPKAAFKIMDCRDIDKIKESFDGIMCGFCMPYISKQDCFKLIKDCSNLLNKTAPLYLSVIEGDYDKSGYEWSSDKKNKTYVYYHEMNYLQEALHQNNLVIKDVTRKHYEKSDGTESIHLIIIATKI